MGDGEVSTEEKPCPEFSVVCFGKRKLKEGNRKGGSQKLAGKLAGNVSLSLRLSPTSVGNKNPLTQP